MHEDVCRLISEAVYDGRLGPEPDNERQRLVLAGSANAALTATGIRFLSVEHDGCSQRSEPEARFVKALFENLLSQAYVDRNGQQHEMTMDNVLVVAPYNAQVNLLRS